MCECDLKIVWMAQIWPKWQIVIPKDIRDKLSLNPWDNLVMILKDDKYIWLVKNEDINDLMSYLNSMKNN